MPRRVYIREAEDDTVSYQGELPAHGIVQNGAGGNAGGGCPDDQIFNATTRKCVDADTGKASKRGVSGPVASASSKTGIGEAGIDDPADVDFVEDSDIPAEFPNGNPQDLGGDTLDAGDDEAGSSTVTSNGPTKVTSQGGDKGSESRRNILYHARVQKAEESARKALQAQRSKLEAKKLRLMEARIDAELARARESAQPKLNVMPAKGTFTGGKVSAVESEVSKPSAWLRAVQQHKNVSPAFVWGINKEKIFETYNKQGIRSFDADGNELIKKTAGEAVTNTVSGPVSTDFMRIMSEQVLVLPNGKVVTPIRQFCETKILPAGTKEAFFFDFGDVTFAPIVDTDSNIAVATPTSTVDIRSAGSGASPRGTRVVIGYTQTEESPIDIVASTNRAFALESVNDESKLLLTTAYNNDAGSSGDASNRKAIGGGAKTGRWVDGNNGTQITSDAAGLGVLKYQGLLAAKGVIQDEGLDDSNLITYTSGKGIRDLTLDADLDSYIGFSRPAIITEATVERIAGTNLVRSSANAATTQSGGTRSVMFIPNVAFGLVTGRDLSMEAQRRNELQAIYITGTQRVAGLVKNVEATCRLSHL